MRRVTRLLAALLMAAAVPAPAQAYFENALLSARTASLGGAFVAIADDPSTVIDNAAGLTGITVPSFMFTWQNPYGVDGLDEGFASAALPAGPVALGAAWFHRGLDGALSEDMLTLSVARDLKRTAEDASLSIGLSVELARVSARAGIDESATAFGLGASVLLRPFAFIGMGYSLQSVNQPQLDLVAGGTSTPLRRTQAAGLSYYWDQRLTVTVETHEGADGIWRGRGGIELDASRHLALRAGLDDSRATAGFGVAWKRVVFDAAMRSHETLGASYVVSLRYSLASGEVSRVAP
ncbi:MAG: hypothetical protein OEX18_03435 [Candidatus Krumholzibacteria bacterium]|nr:hypothetical protein [Candidatus Krumholzibacteria bacterium]MDH4336312.1 hypothetical protein [Candidatus Krumholzibacteria bacterium]MDH5270947.1 hypothetical protein [Candidatus Krumholzibacteria bacterium]